MRISDWSSDVCSSDLELLIKAREAMIAAVHTFNSAGLMFRAELFITTAIVAWTYLLHAYYKREGIPYKYKGKQTAHGADRYRSEERRVGKECVSKCKSSGSPYHEKKKTKKKNT